MINYCMLQSTILSSIILYLSSLPFFIYTSASIQKCRKLLQKLKKLHTFLEKIMNPYRCESCWFWVHNHASTYSISNIFTFCYNLIESLSLWYGCTPYQSCVWKIDWQRNCWSAWPADWLIDMLINSLTDRLSDWLIHWLTNWYTNWLTD